MENLLDLLISEKSFPTPKTRRRTVEEESFFFALFSRCFEHHDTKKFKINILECHGIWSLFPLLCRCPSCRLVFGWLWNNFVSLRKIGFGEFHFDNRIRKSLSLYLAASDPTNRSNVIIADIWYPPHHMSFLNFPFNFSPHRILSFDVSDILITLSLRA